MTIVQLEYFLSVATHGSLATAAEHCFVTAAALSMQISSLENDLGVALLDRSKKPLVLTQAGRAFLEQAQKAVSAFYKTREKIDDIKGRMSGNLRIGVIPTVSPYLMPSFVPMLIQKCPDVKVRIYDMYTPDLVEALAHDRIDVAILSGGQSEIRISETELFDDRLYMYVSPGNELYGRAEIEIDDVDVSKLLILSDGNCLRNQTLKLCEARKAFDPPFDFVRSSLENLMATAERTDGTTIIPGMAIRSIPEERRDRIIPFANAKTVRKVTMAVAPTYAKEALINMVKETLLEVAAEELALSDFLLPARRKPRD